MGSRVGWRDMGTSRSLEGLGIREQAEGYVDVTGMNHAVWAVSDGGIH